MEGIWRAPPALRPFTWTPGRFVRTSSSRRDHSKYSSLHRPAPRKPPRNSTVARFERISHPSPIHASAARLAGQSSSRCPRQAGNVGPIRPEPSVKSPEFGPEHDPMTTSSGKTIFITGATGLVGSHAAEEALRRGHRVRALVRGSSDTRWLDQWGVEKVQGDLADPDALRRGVAGADWVFNCAAKVGDWGTLEEFRKLNVEAFDHLLEAATEAKVQRFVHVSSLGVYEGRDHFGTDETTPPAAQSLDAYT